MLDPLLKDKGVLVTGANNPFGIGAGIARAFAARGQESSCIASGSTMSRRRAPLPHREAFVKGRRRRGRLRHRAAVPPASFGVY